MWSLRTRLVDPLDVVANTDDEIFRRRCFQDVIEDESEDTYNLRAPFCLSHRCMRCLHHVMGIGLCFGASTVGDDHEFDVCLPPCRKGVSSEVSQI